MSASDAVTLIAPLRRPGALPSALRQDEVQNVGARGAGGVDRLMFEASGVAVPSCTSPSGRPPRIGRGRAA